MPYRHSARYDAPPERVRDAAREALELDEATEEGEALHALTGRLDNEIVEATPLTVEIEPVDAGGRATEVRFEAERPPRIPYFHWAVGWAVRLGARRHLRHAAEAISARLEGRPDPPRPRRSPFAPPVPFGTRQAHSVATVCAAAAVTAFGAALFTNNIDFIGEAFDVSNDALGVAGAVTRVGLLVSLVATALADRRGRRKLLLVSIGAVAVSSAVSAAAPNLAVLAAAQLVARGFFNSAFVVAAIAAVEEAPEGARAYSLAVLTLATGFGQGFAVALLPLGDLGPEAWRLSFLAHAATLALLPGLGRRLAETLRYTSLARRHTPMGRPRELVSSAYRSRFVLLLAAAFLTNVLAAPSSQFTNRFLGDERGFSGLDIALFRGATSAIPPVIGLFLGGYLAETLGRKRVAVPGKILATVFTVWFFVSSGAGIWVVGTIEVFFVSLVAPALAAFGPELFPTQVRGTANALFLVAGVTGSAVGLVAVGVMSDAAGLGTAIAWVSIAPLLSALFVLPRLPEASHRDLDAVSPPQV